ncbi:hypothetical protein Z043_123108 [Scleropages formosus]|uniref:Uncharacterized protein n=1 Tax=Scleropages formosus TaxID=113540 RepID=A0A0P7W871_SCLFO|nr:hypothetical protein Z043_123108 [Scleropages formosus]
MPECLDHVSGWTGAAVILLYFLTPFAPQRRYRGQGSPCGQVSVRSERAAPHALDSTLYSPVCLCAQTSVNRKQVESVAKKKLDTLMKESKIRDREDPDNFTVAALPPEKLSQVFLLHFAPDLTSQPQHPS